MTRKFSPAQLDYLKAKTLVQVLAKEKDRLMSEQGIVYTQDMTEEQLDQSITAENEIETRIGYAAAVTAEIQAEQDLIAWGKSKVSRFPLFEKVKIVYEKYHNYPDVREKLINLTLRLQA